MVHLILQPPIKSFESNEYGIFENTWKPMFPILLLFIPILKCVGIDWKWHNYG